MKIGSLAVGVSCLFAGHALAAGPFGFEWGMTKEQVIRLVGQEAVKQVKGDPDDLLTLTTAPKPHPDFREYVLLISPERGLLKIGADGTFIHTTRYGDRLKDTFNEMRDTIAKTYGAPNDTFDFLRSGSLWDRPEDWMMGLLKEERTLRSYWRFKSNPNHITLIGLEASALSTELGYLWLVYEFEGLPEYLDARKAKAGTVF